MIMGGNNSNRARFPLPENWTVENTTCVVITVPDDREYIAMLRGLLETLTWQRSFQLHPTESAAYLVSKTWESAFETDIREVSCSVVEFRINPTTCLLEVNCDETGDDWKPVFTSDYDPSSDAPEPPSLYPDPPPTGQSNACLAAANMTAMLQNGVNNISTLIDDGAAFGAVLSYVFSFISQVVTLVQSQLWPDFQVVYSTWNEATIRADYLAFDWDELKNILVCYLDESGQWDGELTIEKITSFNDAVNEVEDRIPDSQIWSVIAFGMKLMGWIGTSLATTWGGITSAICEPCGAFWEHEFDFETYGALGWTARDSNEGVIGSGGWVNNGGDNAAVFIQITLDAMETGSLFRAKIEYSASGSAGAYHQMGLQVANNGSWQWLPSVDPIDTGSHIEHVFDRGIDDPVSFDHVLWGVYWNSTVVIHKITLYGTGVDPFL